MCGSGLARGRGRAILAPVKKKNRFHNKLALVTGAGSGIGRATALALAGEGANLVLCDINHDNLEGAAAEARALGGDVMARVVDVSKRDAVRAFAEEVHATLGPLDVLVNNAGVALVGSIADTSLDDWEWILSINLWGVIHGVHFFVPPMAARGSGHVVNVSSVAGLVAAMPLGAYSTTKFAVVGLSEALRDELSQKGVGVTVICPGVINTPIVSASRNRGKYAGDAFRERTAKLYRQRDYGPDKVAAAILDAIEHNRGVVPVSPEAWALWAAQRVSPALAVKAVRALNKRMTQ